jgi:hypothetical protein
MASPQPRAACKETAGFPVFQCGDRAYFEAPPDGAGAVRGRFWQLGYGNGYISNGEGISGMGMAPAGVFNGNDNGLWPVPVVAAASLAAEAGSPFPEGALCLGPVNWGNGGVDGCCDNQRALGPHSASDGMLNPNYDLRRLRDEGHFALTTDGQGDFPMAILLTEETGRFFAVAAVASMERSTEAPDGRLGHYTLGDVVDGSPNPLTGARNAIPWQRAPAIRFDAAGEAPAPAPGAPAAWSYRATWDPITLPSDRSHRPSTAGRLEGSGVGVADMGPLVSYTVEKVSLIPGMFDAGGLIRTGVLLWERAGRTTEPAMSLALGEDTCVRVVVQLGRVPSTGRIAPLPCALGLCGDIGFEIPGPALCLEGPLLAGAQAKR